MRKTLLITLDFPPQVGGVARYWEKLCSRLPKEKIIVLAPKVNNANSFDSLSPYKIYRKKLITTFPFIWPKWLFLIFQTRQVIRQENIEQIIVGQILPVGTVTLLIKKLWNIPYFISSHAQDITILKNSWRKTKIAKKILEHAEKIITVSNFTFKKLINLGVKKEKITIISPGTDIHLTSYPDKQEEIKKRFQLEGKRILLTIGRIIERKGHLKVLKCLPEIINRFPQVIYLIGSSGPFIGNLKIYIKKNKLEKNVIFTGEIPQAELPCYYQLCELFLMPCSELANGDVEGFGIVYLEASAFAKPIIAFSSGGIGDAIINNETGLLVNPNDSFVLSQTIIQLLENRELAQKLGEQGRKRVLEQFQWDSRAEKLKAVLSGK